MESLQGYLATRLQIVGWGGKQPQRREELRFSETHLIEGLGLDW